MNFTRLLDFCSTAGQNVTENDIRFQLPDAIEKVPQVFEPYERILEKLDESTWEIVKQKFLNRTIKHPTRGWSQFYETLAEADGFCYLLDLGYANVHFIPENQNARTPDIEATKPGGNLSILESKNISFSDDERSYILENTRRLHTNETLQVRDVTQGMPDELKNKINSTIQSAKEQLLGYLPNNNSVERTVYLTIQLDIPMYLNQDNYKEVVNFVNSVVRTETEIIIKISNLSSI